MKYFDFLELPLEEMLEVVLCKGIYLTRRARSQYIVELYAVDNFFVEIGVSSPDGMINDCFLTYTNAFQGSKGLEPYLEDRHSFELIKSL